MITRPLFRQPQIDTQFYTRDDWAGFVNARAGAGYLFGVIVLLLQIDTVGLQKAFYDNYLEILRFVSHDPFFADWYAWPRLRDFRS